MVLLKKIVSKKGFSTFELIMGMMVMSIILVVTAQTISNHTDAFYFIANRKSSIADLRFAIKKVSSELEYIKSGDITAVGQSLLTFSPSNAAPVTYQYHTVNSIERNGIVLIEHVNNFWFDYYDMLGNPLAPNSASIPNIRRIKITIQSQPRGKEGSVTMSAMIVPRAFLGFDLQ